MTNAGDKPGETKPRPHWTVMVYMAAANSSELDAVAVEDLREMERGVNENVNVAVQINRAWPAVPQRYKIRPGPDAKRGVSEFAGVDTAGTNMGDKATLTGFLKWALSAFPADHYCLVLWGHAYGLGFGRDHGDPLTLKELREALHYFREERQAHAATKSKEPDGQLELLGANACGMSYVEAAYELRDHTQYIAASQIAVPYAGWPYELILRRIDRTTTPEQLGELVVDAYVSDFNGLVAGERVTMSLLKLEALSVLAEELRLRGIDDFKDVIEKLAVAVREESRLVRPVREQSPLFGTAREESRLFGPSDDRRAYVRDVFLAAAYGDVRPLIDLEDLCRDFGDAATEALRTITAAVLTFLPSFVVRHKGHPQLLEHLHGVGIFAPFVADDEDLKRLELQDDTRNGGPQTKSGPQTKTGRRAYQSLQLFTSKNATWPQLVYDELRQTAASEFTTALPDSGSENNRDIRKVVLPIESSFNQLDRVLDECRRRINEALGPALQRAAETDGSKREGGKRFASPWLKLTFYHDERLATLTQAVIRRRLASAGTASGRVATVDSTAEPDHALVASDPLDSMQGADPEFVSRVVDFFGRIEKAVGDVEKATRKGLTHARLGLGPAAPHRFAFAEEPKTGDHGFAEEPKTGDHGFTEEPKTGDHGNGGFQGGSRDLRIDLAFARVVELFGRVGRALRQVEDATSELENVARVTLSDGSGQLSQTDGLKAAAEAIRRALTMLEDASKNARRTIRSVITHPVYGLGPGASELGLDEREALANAGGLSSRNLRLL